MSVEELDASWAVFSPALLALEGTKPERYAMVPWGRRSSAFINRCGRTRR